MNFKTIVNLFNNGQLHLSLALLGKLKPFYKLCFIASAKTNGLLELLSDKPIPFEQLAESYCQNSRTNGALEAWLQLGVRLKLLKSDPQ